MLTAKHYKIFFWSLQALFILWLCGFILFAKYINNYPPFDEQKTDAVVVLTGGRNRISEGVRLLNAEAADKLFISGVSPHVTIKDIEEKIHIKINNPEKVELGFKATNTIGNAREVTEWIEQNHINSVRLVTSNYHLPRSMAELKAFHLPLKILAYPVYSEKVAGHWWQSWGTFKFIFAEYNKFLFVCLRNFFYLVGVKK